MRDLITSLAYTRGLASTLVQAAAVLGDAIDLRGTNAVAFFVTSDVTADAVTGANPITISFEDADEDPANPGVPLAASWAAVPARKVFGDSGVIATNAAVNLKFGVDLTKRFVRVKATPTGAHAAGTTLRAHVVKGHLQAEGKGW